MKEAAASSWELLLLWFGQKSLYVHVLKDNPRLALLEVVEPVGCGAYWQYALKMDCGTLLCRFLAHEVRRLFCHVRLMRNPRQWHYLILQRTLQNLEKK
jgi:hypothetical protein